MEITEVRIKLMDDGSERLKAFCSITFDDCFVIRDLKIIEGTNGPFVAMPSRKLTAHCPQCGCKNHLRAPHCNQCGLRLKDDRAIKDEDGRTKLYADIAHPINSACREMIQQRVIAEFALEQERAKQPGYVSRYDDIDYDTPEPHVRVTPQHAPTQPAARQDAPRQDAARQDAPRQAPPAPHVSPQKIDRGGATPPAPPDRGRVEPAASEPPPPHRPRQAPPPGRGTTTPHRPEPREFGEGIF
ncbi:MAG: septation protein SpoVG family protein [Planctomycetia bacterium]|nr:septation protein SpoVG family protein [Planctomycetia bacterium]